MPNILRFRDLISRGIVRHKATLERWIEAGNFPPPFYLTPGGPRCWTDEVVADWLASRQQVSFCSTPHKAEQT